MKSLAGPQPKLAGFACRDPLIAPGLQPKAPRHLQRIDIGDLPPLPFVTTSVQLAMVQSTQGNGEFIAHFASQRRLLSKAEVMGIRQRPTRQGTGADEL
jgi:hypothetical protein